MEDTRKIFAAGAKKIAEIKEFSQEYIAAQIKDGKQGTVSSWLRGRTKFPVERMSEFAVLFNMSIEEVLAVGRQERQPEENMPEIIQKEVTKQINDLQSHKIKKNESHYAIVDQFQQPELAEEINHLLLKIEEKKKTRLAKIKTFLLAELKELEIEEIGDQEKDPKNKAG